MSWNMHADVRMRTSATQGGGGGEEEEDEEEEEGSAALSLNVFTKSALQLTVTKTSLSIFNELWQVGVMAGCHTTHMHTQCQTEIDRHTHTHTEEIPGTSFPLSPSPPAGLHREGSV